MSQRLASITVLVALIFIMSLANINPARAGCSPTIIPNPPTAGAAFNVSGTTTCGADVIIFAGSSCSSGNMVFDVSIGATTTYSLTVPGLMAGSYSVTDGTTPPDCVNFTVMPASIPEYPIGLPILSILIILAYGLIRRRTTTKRK